MEEERTVKKLNNQGLTLVELIIVMALAGIVSLIAFSFLQSGTQFYNTISAEVDLQMESQTTYNQIREMVMNAERGAVAFGMPTSSDNRKLVVSGKSYRALVIYNSNNVQVILYDPASKKLYLLEEARTSAQYGNQAHVISCISKIKDENLMSAGVSEFDVDTTKLNSVASNGMLSMKLVFTKKGENYTCESYVTLRNDNVKNPDERYE
ncbi:PilW family protein [Anaerosporobacter faecicola]|uniref:PilW family protein n=1 Tax=Anaerosporobacter faecicola TaxID=2718714 RepID=UPI00143C3EB5|nr:prepilin-type N-terminal cleavage/methylation domain-containing protein [Anaerosporobacter faecicola]